MARGDSILGARCSHPDHFLRTIDTLYAQPEAESFELLEFKDGRRFERYSIGRAVGPAVTRNLVRRRLRSLMQLEAGRGLPPGAYLVGAGRQVASCSYSALSAHVATLCDRTRRSAT